LPSQIALPSSPWARSVIALRYWLKGHLVSHIYFEVAACRIPIFHCQSRLESASLRLTGFHIFLPMLIVSVAAHTGHLSLDERFAWLATSSALITLSVAAFMEILAYYVPVVNNLLDTLATPASLVAGSVPPTIVTLAAAHRRAVPQVSALRRSSPKSPAKPQSRFRRGRVRRAGSSARDPEIAF
jgi:hypothetical protein